MGSGITVFCDGLCEPYNPGGVATYGFVIQRGGELIQQGSGVLGEGEGMTNNVAEYTAAIEALRWLLEHGYEGRRVTLMSDSMLLIKQLRGLWQVRSPRIAPLYHQARKLASHFKVRFRWVSREENEAADALSVEAYVEYQESKRWARVAGVVGRLSEVGDGLYQVQAEPTPYVVDLREGRCTCPDFRKLNSQRFSIRCKHILAALEVERNGGSVVPYKERGLSAPWQRRVAGWPFET